MLAHDAADILQIVEIGGNGLQTLAVDGELGGGVDGAGVDQQGLAGLDDGVQGIGNGVGARTADQHGSLGIKDAGDDLLGLHGGDGLIQTGDHAQVTPGQDLMAGELPGDAVDDLELKLHRLFQADGVQGIGYHRDLLLVFD